MPSIKSLQENGRHWYITHCEVVISRGATEGMSSRKILKALAASEQLCQRFTNYLEHCSNNAIPSKGSFESIAEFELNEKTPELGYRDRSPVQARTPNTGLTARRSILRKRVPWHCSLFLFQMKKCAGWKK